MMRTIQLVVACVAVLIATAGQVKADLIAGVTATSSDGTFGTYTLSNLTNGVGLTPSISTTATHSTFFGDMWLNSSGGTVGNLIFDLGGTYSFSDIAIWQYDNDDDQDRGVKDFTLESSSDGISFTPLLGTTTLSIAQYLPITNEPAQIFALGNTTASHVRLNYLNNYGDPVLTGLSEVQFVEATAIPEPSTIAMFGIGAGVMGLVSIRRRRREQKQATPA
ncbi:MAG: PEP-CTERM sorting domain-containing protein [Pirellulaceae bacterium]|nr:PEP-CTERM sorting domain-containing protein [Pirellulaceae bacterium]